MYTDSGTVALHGWCVTIRHDFATGRAQKLRIATLNQQQKLNYNKK